ncbi:nucleotidyltransferase family protein [Porticoccus sp.]|uniref:nucleotidyltransferase domain-containing protein n=1 Tax=Porticoccus sp. TaxID=2024853 RepID=UPI000C63D1CD|nr:nucleotidyltransferase family protein [Porticoccus sp.]MAZ69633.1 hypothetical protein [Porticoccus sp.]|tara:strand:+ start:45777 stop:46865 length:1089 start_codon:yes stop_codon:yes gene_type:complete
MPESIMECCLVRFLRDPQHSATRLSPGEWQMLVRQARRSNLLSRMAHLVEIFDLLSFVPEHLQSHLHSAQLVSSSNLRSVKWEILQIYTALSEAGIPFALLKGAAYVMSERDASQGRLFGDIDILVRNEQLKEAEKALIKHGWFCTKIDPYDQKYYRTWMHELPPLKHLKRQTDLDVHHTILPPTADAKPDINKIWEQVIELKDYPGMYVLSLQDMILHSAAHLFHEGDFEQGLRDVVDLDALLREYALESGDAWAGLFTRAKTLHLSRSLYYGLRYAKMLLKTPVPEELTGKIAAGAEPFCLSRYLMDKMLLKAMMPNCLGQKTRLLGLARFILFIRSHYLRMPMRLLIPHLLRKAIRQEK